MSILLIGLNHVSTPVALRERLFFGASAVVGGLEGLCSLPGIAEAVIISTCNRTEIYAVGEDAEPVIEWLAGRGRMPVDEVMGHLYEHVDDAAADHLMRVACGLDSLMVGEPQILAQVKEAWRAAEEAGFAGRELSALFQQAVVAGKRARSETGISDGAYSIGRAAVELAGRVFGDLGNSPILLLGAGKMSELTARHLASRGVSAIFVANRTHAHAVELAERLGGQAIHYEELSDALSRVDIVISSTSAPHVVLHAGDVRRAMEAREGRPLCLIDIAVPRDIDPVAGDIPGVSLHNIDDLRAVTEKDQRRRLKEIPRVEQIIHEEEARWSSRRAGMRIAPVISALRGSFEHVRCKELREVSAVLETLNHEQRRAVEALTQSIVNTLLHQPTMKLKEYQARGGEEMPVSMVCELFGLSVRKGGEE